MQARAIFEAAVAVAKDGVKVFPKLMIPLTATLKEMANQRPSSIVAKEVFGGRKKRSKYLVGTMIELPRLRWSRMRLPRKPSSFHSHQRSDPDHFRFLARRYQQGASTYLKKASSSRIRSLSSIRKESVSW